MQTIWNVLCGSTWRSIVLANLVWYQLKRIFRPELGLLQRNKSHVASQVKFLVPSEVGKSGSWSAFKLDTITFCSKYSKFLLFSQKNVLTTFSLSKNSQKDHDEHACSWIEQLERLLCWKVICWTVFSKFWFIHWFVHERSFSLKLLSNWKQLNFTIFPTAFSN